VRRMAETLAARCRAASWVRTSIASLERFRVMTGTQDLEALLERCRRDVTEAEGTLQAFAGALTGYTDTQVAALAIGPKLWFRLNGVAVPWRPLTAGGVPLPLAVADRHAVDRLVLLALIGSGLHLAELLRLQVGDAGSLGPDGRIISDIEADPLAVGYVSRRGRPHEQITFLSHPARAALLADVERRQALGQLANTDAPLIARHDGAPATAATVAYARRRNAALIQAGNAVNVALCRVTGDFFRAWGMPGARFVEPCDQSDQNVC
jgi:hypothetical protein